MIEPLHNRHLSKYVVDGYRALTREVEHCKSGLWLFVHLADNSAQLLPCYV